MDGDFQSRSAASQRHHEEIDPFSAPNLFTPFLSFIVRVEMHR
jgi:hypothetical protein